MGQLNILHHKSWHVYNRENRAKVKEDQREAREEEDEQAQKRIQSERDFRLQILRSRAKSKQISQTYTGNDQPSESAVLDLNDGPNPKADIEEASEEVGPKYEPETLNVREKSVEHASAATTAPKIHKKKDKLKREKKHEFGAFLGQSNNNKTTAWYAKRKFKDTDNDPAMRTKDDMTKMRDDPLAFINSSLSKSRERRERIKQEQRELEQEQYNSLHGLGRNSGLYSTEDPHFPVTKNKYSTQYNPEATYSAHHHEREKKSREHDRRQYEGETYSGEEGPSRSTKHKSKKDSKRHKRESSRHHHHHCKDKRREGKESCHKRHHH